MRKRIHYTPEEKQHHIRQCDQSGMSKKSYAESAGVDFQIVLRKIS